MTLASIHPFPSDSSAGPVARPLRAVTRLVNGAFPSFNAGEVIERMQSSPRWSASPYFGQTAADIQRTWTAKGRAAAAEGVRLHRQIENYYNARPVEYTEEDFLQFLDFDAAKVVHDRLTPLRVEWRICAPALQVAGTLDAVFRKPDGSVVLVDWKRTAVLRKSNPWEKGLLKGLSHVPATNFWKYALQLNLYKTILESAYRSIGPVSEMLLVCFHPDRDAYEVREVPPLTSESAALLASLVVDAEPGADVCGVSPDAS